MRGTFYTITVLILAVLSRAGLAAAVEPIHVGKNSVDLRRGFVCYIYGADNERRLVVCFEKSGSRFDVPLSQPGFAPFCYDGNIFIVSPDGVLTTYSVESTGLHKLNVVTLTTNAIRAVESDPSTGSLFFIEGKFEASTDVSVGRSLVYELVGYGLGSKERLWSRPLKRPGILTINEKTICVLSEKTVEVFGTDHGEDLHVFENGFGQK